jgi:hypothetical protein
MVIMGGGGCLGVAAPVDPSAEASVLLAVESPVLVSLAGDPVCVVPGGALRLLVGIAVPSVPPSEDSVALESGVSGGALVVGAPDPWGG